MKKLVLKIDMLEEGGKRKAMKTVAGLSGIDSISIDMKERKLTIIGTVDPTKVVSKLRKYWTTELLTVGPAKQPEEAKKEEPNGGDKKPATGAENELKKEGGNDVEKKAEEVKKEESKKEGDEGGKANAAEVSSGGGGGGGGGEGGKKVVEEEKKVDPVLEMVKAYRAYNPQMTKYYYVQSMEENPNACVIC